jgi:hypothetical protein
MRERESRLRTSGQLSLMPSKRLSRGERRGQKERGRGPTGPGLTHMGLQSARTLSLRGDS